MIREERKKLIGVLETGTYFHNSINNLIRKTLAQLQREIIFVKSITHKNLVKFLKASPSSSQNTNRNQAWLKERKGHWNILMGGCCNQLFTVHPIICLILHISRLNKHVSYVHHHLPCGAALTVLMTCRLVAAAKFTRRSLFSSSFNKRLVFQIYIS